MQVRSSSLSTALSLLIVMATTTVHANDDCVDAFVAEIGTYVGEITTATPDGSSSCASSTGADVWYCYTAAEDGTLAVETCGSTFDTVLSLHSDCPGTTANQIACNDDACGFESSVSTPVVVGDVVLVRISGFGGGVGDYTLSLAGPAGVPPGGGPTEPEFTRGDINNDGVFDISDPVNLLATLFVAGTPAPTCFDAGDVNDDGAIDISDAVSALAALFVAGSSPPGTPFPSCGEDPTDDPLDCAGFSSCP